MGLIFKRYGTAFHSVEKNFDSLALNEVAFRRDRAESVSVDDMESDYDTVVSHDLVAEAEGDVQDHTEQQLLDQLAARLDELAAGLGTGELLVVENDQGTDWPKTRQRTSNVIVEGENRLRFHYTVAPALRVTVRRRKG
jgi:hypothetical protein